MEVPNTSGTRACTPNEYQRFLNGDASLHCLSRGQIIGLVMVILSAFASLIAVLLVFGMITRNALRRAWRILVDPVDIIILSILFGDAIQALGELINIKWVRDGKVEIGAHCTAQGVLKQLGHTSVPMSILLLAVYTFRGLWIGVLSESLRVTKILVTGIWVFVTLMIVLGNILHLHEDNQHRFIAPVPYWCWIGSDYTQWRLWGQYFWFWLTLAVSILTYIPIFLWSRGVIAPHPQSWWRFRRVGNDFSRELENLAKIMLAYPIIFCITILPLSIVRWMHFQQENDGGHATIPSAATFASQSLLVLSGVFNVALLLITRPNAGLFGR